ncbi:hypothetical protein K7472_29860 [Streptomyces sp. PTM05]|uniref:Uncharacterized protein n=1 Tax=Streptantibioticus parmotrematis TaxID=2873249 RepID=A0ABS7R4P7_9ACTN|nr:hypothetical protein [Streptantibioticus parmotrematis]MBY8889019.1 hypothetical protein [Streptantibioticus parmotrematis]
MSEDVGGKPFPDGDDHGDADDAFASVVLDEAFVEAAVFHEPSARERMLAAAQARAEAEATPARVGAADDDGPDDDPRYYDAYGPGEYDAFAAEHGRFGVYRQRHIYGTPARWHRTVAWVLALVMGVGVVSLAFAAVYRTGGQGRQPAPPPATGRADLPRATTRPTAATTAGPLLTGGGAPTGTGSRGGALSTGAATEVTR